MNDRITVTTLTGAQLSPLLAKCRLDGNALVVAGFKFRLPLSPDEAHRVRLALAGPAAIERELVRAGVVRGKLDAIAKREMDDGTYDVMYTEESE